MKKDEIKLPPLPEWSMMDDLCGLVPSEIRQALTIYAREAIEFDRQRVGEPVASALFSENGNIRIWSTSKLTSHPDAIPLYAALQPADINIDYKQLYEQMYERCDYLDVKLAEHSEQPTPAAQEPSAPDHLIERLRKHCDDKSNTAFARSSMREALQYLSKDA